VKDRAVVPEVVLALEARGDVRLQKGNGGHRLAGRLSRLLQGARSDVGHRDIAIARRHELAGEP
jgi:hypothetical protein